MERAPGWASPSGSCVRLGNRYRTAHHEHRARQPRGASVALNRGHADRNTGRTIYHAADLADAIGEADGPSQASISCAATIAREREVVISLAGRFTREAA